MEQTRAYENKVKTLRDAVNIVIPFINFFMEYNRFRYHHPVRLRLPPLRRRGIPDATEFPSSGGVARRAGVVCKTLRPLGI